MTNVRSVITFVTGKTLEVEIDSEGGVASEMGRVVRDLAKISAHHLAAMNFDSEVFISAVRREADRIVKEGERASEAHARQFALASSTNGITEEGIRFALETKPIDELVAPKFPHPVRPNQIATASVSDDGEMGK